MDVYVDKNAQEECAMFKERTRKQEEIEEPIKVKEDGTKTTLSEAKKAENNEED